MQALQHAQLHTQTQTQTQAQTSMQGFPTSPAPTHTASTTVVGSTDSADGCSTATYAVIQDAVPSDTGTQEDEAVDGAEGGVRRSARARVAVDYALPSLRTKLRRGDRHTFGEAMRRRQPGRTKPPRRRAPEDAGAAPALDHGVDA